MRAWALPFHKHVIFTCNYIGVHEVGIVEHLSRFFPIQSKVNSRSSNEGVIKDESSQHLPRGKVKLLITIVDPKK